ncbi:MAG: hypothetical protein WHT06_00105 [Desulfobacterales bacterium]
MDLARTDRAAKRLGRVGLVVFLVFFAFLLDSCVARFREPLFTVNLLPGESAWVDGMLDPEVKDLARLEVESEDETVRLRLDRIQQGFWLGGTMWVGEVTVAPGASPGARELRVRLREKPPEEPPVGAWRVVVHTDADSLRRSRLSLLRRHFGIAPGLAALACVPLLALVLLRGYLLGRRRERLLAAEGFAEIFLSRSVPGGTEVFFGLFPEAGVAPGGTVAILDREGRPIAAARVERTDGRNALALASGFLGPLPPGACVRLAAGGLSRPAGEQDG